jgi:hypothetical protein
VGPLEHQVQHRREGACLDRGGAEGTTCERKDCSWLSEKVSVSALAAIGMASAAAVAITTACRLMVLENRLIGEAPRHGFRKHGIQGIAGLRGRLT